MKELDLIRIRKNLHQNAELSGKESKTSEIIKFLLAETNPSKIVTDIGGNGVVAIYTGKTEGLTVLFRCELDALPIPETIEMAHSSKSDGISHKCGHDGHMTIMLAFANRLAKNPLKKGNVILLFQSSEETGEGARLTIDDQKFHELVPEPDYVFALHNLPGFPLGQVLVREQIFASASIGLIVDLFGSTSHASEPQNGRSPAMAISQIIQGLSSAPQFHTALHEACQVTIIQARLGEVAFGTSPGYGQVLATLRSHSSEVLIKLKKVCEIMVGNIARANELEFKFRWQEEFPATENNEKAVAIINKAALKCNLLIHQPPTPFAWSEDFGHFTRAYKGALFGLGSGEKHPALHHPDYDFPDDLIEVGVNMFEAILQQTLDNRINH